MPKAARVLAALKRDGWAEIRRAGSHRVLVKDDLMSATLRAEFYFDDEARNWHYRVPALHINGGGAASREDAERDCLDAISFTLQGDPNDYDSDNDAVTLVVAPVA